METPPHKDRSIPSLSEHVIYGSDLWALSSWKMGNHIRARLPIDGSLATGDGADRLGENRWEAVYLIYRLLWFNEKFLIKGPFTYPSSSEIWVGKLDGGVSTSIQFR